MYSESYFDYTDLNNPVKFRLVRENFMAFSTHSVQLNYMKLRPNIVRKPNGFEQNMYTLELESYLNRPLSNNFYPCAFIIYMDNEYDYYQHYVNYQPRSTPIDRTLSVDDIDKNEHLMSTEYFILYIMSQIGGLYCFLTLILGIVVKSFNRSSQLFDLVNAYVTEIKKLHSVNTIYSPNDANLARVVPVIVEEAKTPNENQLNVENEKDALIKEKSLLKVNDRPSSPRRRSLFDVIHENKKRNSKMYAQRIVDTPALRKNDDLRTFITFSR